MAHVSGVDQRASHKGFQEHLVKVRSIAVNFACAIDAVFVVVVIIIAVLCSCSSTSLPFSPYSDALILNIFVV